MSTRVISQTKPKANKSHTCNACEFLREGGDHLGNNTGITFAEFRAIAKAKKNNWQIMLGDVYLRQRNTDGETQWIFKAIPAIDGICWKLDLYDY